MFGCATSTIGSHRPWTIGGGFNKKKHKIEKKKKDRIKSISIQLIYIDAPQGFKDDVPHQFIFVQLFMRPLITVFPDAPIY